MQIKYITIPISVVVQLAFVIKLLRAGLGPQMTITGAHLYTAIPNILCQSSKHNITTDHQSKAKILPYTCHGVQH